MRVRVRILVHSWMPMPCSHGENCWSVKAVSTFPAFLLVPNRRTLWLCSWAKITATSAQSLAHHSSIPLAKAWLAAFVLLRNIQEKRRQMSQGSAQKNSWSSISMPYFISACQHILLHFPGSTCFHTNTLDQIKVFY